MARYRKAHLSKVRVGPDATSEGDVLAPGSTLDWFEVEGDAGTRGNGNGFRIGLACCFDLRFKELADVLCDPPPRGIGSDVLLYPSAWCVDVFLLLGLVLLLVAAVVVAVCGGGGGVWCCCW